MLTCNCFEKLGVFLKSKNYFLASIPAFKSFHPFPLPSPSKKKKIPPKMTFLFFSCYKVCDWLGASLLQVSLHRQTITALGARGKWIGLCKNGKGCHQFAGSQVSWQHWGKKKPPIPNLLSSAQHRHSGKIHRNLYFPTWSLTSEAPHAVIERQKIDLYFSYYLLMLTKASSLH